MLFLNNDDQATLITPAEALDALSEGLEKFEAGDAMRRPRIDNIIPTSKRGSFFNFSSMEGGVRGGYYALRIKPDIFEFPSENGVRRVRSYNGKVGQYGGLVLLFDVESAELVAILNDGYVQHLRVVTSAALGAKYLSKPDAKVLGIIGSGGMARFLAPSIQAVRSLERVQVFSTNPDNLSLYCTEMQEALGIEVIAMPSAREVCRGADILCAATSSLEPVLFGEWIEAGTHLNTVTPWELSDDACAKVTTMGLHVDRPPMTVGSFADEGFAIRLGVMSWAIGTDEELSPWPYGSPPMRFTNAKIVKTCDWSSGLGYRRESEDEITVLANSSFGILEGDAGLSAGIQGLQFATIAGRMYMNSINRDVGTQIPQEMFVQSMVT